MNKIINYFKGVNWKNILIYTVGILLLLLVLQTVRTCNKQDKIEEQSGLISSLNDTVKVWKDKNGLSHSKIEVITTKDPSDFTKIKGLEGENKKLQDKVKQYENKIKNGGSVTNFTSETKTQIVTKTIVDTVRIAENVYPVYKSDFDLQGWVKGNVEARPDSIKINQTVVNEYTVVIGEDKQGFLGMGKPKPFVEVTNLNPYSTTPVLKTYKVDTKVKKKGWLYFVGGVLVGGATTVYLINK